MAAKTPIRGVFSGSTATGLAEYQSGDFIALTHGGLGASLSIGSAGQVLKVNSGASALEFGSVEAIVNIDGATDLESATLAVGDKLLLSDGGTEGRVLLSQLDTLYSGTTKTLTNKTISGSANTLSNIGNSSLSNSSVNFGGVTVALGASDTTPAFDLSDATSYPTSSLTGTITNAQLAGSIANAKLANSSITVTDGSNSTATALGGTITFTAGEGMDVTESSGAITFAGEDATTSNKGIASFSSDDFSVSSGAVTVKSSGITNTQLAGSIANAKLANSSITVTDGSNSTATALGGTITFTAGEGMDVTEGSGTITFAGEDATTSNKGVASFSSDNFAVSSGAVTIKDGGVVTAELADDAVTAAKLANTSVSAASYGSSTAIPVITVDAQGRLTAASTASISTDLTIVDTASTSATISLATDTLKIQGTTNEVDTSVSGDTITIGLPNNVTIAGNLTVNGTTTTVSSTNTTVSDSLLELNSGATSNANDTGIIMERGSTGDNAIFMFDESADKFVVATTTATADSTGNISHTKADFEGADIKGSTGTFTSTGIGSVLTVTGTDDGATEGPALVIKRNSASPADDDKLGALVFKGENDADQAVTYGKISANALDVSLDATALFLNTGTDLTFEGDGADAHELTLTVADSLDADRTVTLPNATGTVALEGTVTSGSTSITTNIGARTFETESLDTPVGFITINIGGTNYKLPYYSA